MFQSETRRPEPETDLTVRPTQSNRLRKPP